MQAACYAACCVAAIETLENPFLYAALVSWCVNNFCNVS